MSDPRVCAWISCTNSNTTIPCHLPTNSSDHEHEGFSWNLSAQKKTESLEKISLPLTSLPFFFSFFLFLFTSDCNAFQFLILCLHHCFKQRLVKSCYSVLHVFLASFSGSSKLGRVG